MLWTCYARWGIGARRADAREGPLPKGIIRCGSSGFFCRHRLLQRGQGLLEEEFWGHLQVVCAGSGIARRLSAADYEKASQDEQHDAAEPHSKPRERLHSSSRLRSFVRGPLEDEFCYGGASRRAGILSYWRFGLRRRGWERGAFARAHRSRRARSQKFLRSLGGCGNQSFRPPGGCGRRRLCFADALGVLGTGRHGFRGGFRRLRRWGQVVRGPSAGGRKRSGPGRGA